MQKATNKASRGFTLLELIIVIAILAILSVAVVLVINPAETLARARDSQRLSDLSAIKSAIGLYMAEVTPPVLNGNDVGEDCGDIWIGTADVTAITDNMCGVAAANQNVSPSGLVDNNGWLPVELTAITSGAPLSNFPLDPTDDIPTGAAANVTMTTDTPLTDVFLYTYMCDSTNLDFEINANMESARYEFNGTSDKESTDGGNTDNLYEVGTDIIGNCPLGGWGL